MNELFVIAVKIKVTANGDVMCAIMKIINRNCLCQFRGTLWNQTSGISSFKMHKIIFFSRKPEKNQGFTSKLR